MSTFRTAESVSPKHPDKLCDQISDAILDAYLEKDPDARVAVETVGGHGKIFITGEITARHDIEITPIVQRIAPNVEIETRLIKQSSEIAHGVDGGGAGDQGIMVGYATDETPELLPLEVVLSRSLNQFLFERWPHDGKTQVTLKDTKIIALVASFQHVARSELLAAVTQWLSQQACVEVMNEPIVHINPAGDWSDGGFDADAGLTGRKLVVDNYGPHVAIGGGCFSGKDASKVDRSGAYMARKIAIDYLKNRNAREVYVYLAYAIGYNQPLEATVHIDGIQESVIGYNLSPRAIATFLDLKRPQYEQTARYGHFGHAEFTWEQ